MVVLKRNEIETWVRRPGFESQLGFGVTFLIFPVFSDKDTKQSAPSSIKVLVLQDADSNYKSFLVEICVID